MMKNFVWSMFFAVFPALILVYAMSRTSFIGVYAFITAYTLVLTVSAQKKQDQLAVKVQSEMKSLVKKEGLINNSLVPINTEEKLKNSLSLEIERCAQTKATTSIVFFDIDDLGTINQNYGYDIGDQIIIDIILATKKDMVEADRLARVKGDTFAILLPDQDKAYAYELCKKINQKVMQIAVEKSIPVTCRFVTLMVDGWTTEEKILELAYEKLKLAKEYGKGVIL